MRNRSKYEEFLLYLSLGILISGLTLYQQNAFFYESIAIKIVISGVAGVCIIYFINKNILRILIFQVYITITSFYIIYNTTHYVKYLFILTYFVITYPYYMNLIKYMFKD